MIILNCHYKMQSAVFNQICGNGSNIGFIKQPSNFIDIITKLLKYFSDLVNELNTFYILLNILSKF